MGSKPTYNYDDIGGTKPPTNAQKNVQADWNVTNSSSDAFIKNKPSIPAAQVQSNWNATSGMGVILNKPNLATVATSGSYNDLTNKPTIPAAQVQSDWNATSGMGVIKNKPTTFTPSSHGHAWSEITGKPTTFTPSTHSHTWSSITGKPTTFAPSSHDHAYENITGLTANTVLGRTTNNGPAELISTTQISSWAMAGNKPSYNLGEIAETTTLKRVSQAEKDTWNDKVDKNANITAGTHPKITYDAKGLVTGGGALAATDIPNLNASKINDGTFATDRIPSLAASKISSGTFDAARIPNLNASKINAGTFDAARIPSLNASKINAGTFSASRIPSLDASKISTGVLSTSRLPSTFVNLTDGVSNLPYKGSIIIHGDSDKYYPVHFAKGNQNLLRTIKIWRTYSEQAPNDWNTSTHKGSLNLEWKGNYGGWGGAVYNQWIYENTSAYTTLLAETQLVDNSYAIAFFLRGGGTTGALYHFASDQPLTWTDSYLTYTEPTAFYNQEKTFANPNSSHERYAPAPRTTVNTSQLNSITVARGISAWAKKSSLAIGDIPTGITGSTVALGNHTHSVATPSSNGFMSVSDKTRLDSMDYGAQVNVGTNLSQGARNATTIRIDSSTGGNVTLPAVTTSFAGLMSAADKTRLDGMATGATANKGTVTQVKVGSTSYDPASGVISLPAYPTVKTYSGSTSITLSGTSFQRAALTGDVTATANSNATTIANNAVTTAKINNNAVTLAKMQNIGTDKVLGSTTSGTGAVEALDMININDLDLGTSWTEVWSGSINLNSYINSYYSATVPSGSYIGKRIAIEVQYGTGTTYTSKIIFGVLGSSQTHSASTSISRGIGWSYFDGTNLRVKTLYTYAATSYPTIIYVGRLKTLFGSFSGSTINWSTSHSETLYMKKIWVIE